MKKLLIVLISLLTVLALTLTISAVVILSGRKKQEKPPEIPVTLPSVTEEVTTEPPATEAPTVAPVTEATTAPTVSHVEPETTKPTEEPDRVFPGVTFRPVDRTVYASQDVNVREGPAVADYKVVGKLKLGQSVQQVGIGDNGWSRVIFEGKKCYIASQYLRTEKPQYGGTPEETLSPEDYPNIKTVSDTVYATGSLNVRTGPGKGYKAIGYLKHGQEAQRVGIADNGWSKIRYNSGYGFVSDAFLSSEKPPKETKWQTVDQTVYATETLNLRTGPSVNHKKAGELKAGENVQRTAIGDNGWSRLYYQGAQLYAASEYLTQKAPADKPTEPAKPAETIKPTEPMPACKEVDENMVAAETLILHAGPGPKYDNLGQLSKGSLVHRTGICSNGWSRILLGGKNVYVVSAYLEEEKKPQPAKPSQPVPTRPAPTDAPENEGYTENKAKVYIAEDDVNVRTGPGRDHKSLAKLPKGTALNRLALGDDGWSKVEFNNQHAYVKSSLLTEEAPSLPENSPVKPENTEKVTYKEVKETVYSTDSVFIRPQPNTASGDLGSLNYGDSIERTAIGDNGWSKVIWDGKTAYAYSKYLSKEKPEMPDFGDTTIPLFPTPNSPFIYQYWDQEDVIPYAIFEPVAGDTSEKLPLIISLHGSAEVRRNREFMEGQHLTKVFREWEYTKLDPIEAYVVCPHINKDVTFDRWGTPQGADAIYKLIDHLKENYNIDETKIILEGHSMGGQGAIYIAADDRACFSKLVIVSGEYANIDYDKITIPVFGCVGGGADKPADQRDAEGIRKFMTTTFKDKFKEAEFFEGPYNHDNVAIQFFQKDEDKNNKSDIIEWMLK